MEVHRSNGYRYILAIHGSSSIANGFRRVISRQRISFIGAKLGRRLQARKPFHRAGPKGLAYAPLFRYMSCRFMDKVFLTGAAGFIGSNLVDRLLGGLGKVVGWDTFSTGQPEFLALAEKNSNFKLIRGDNLDLPALTEAMKGCDTIFHLAANADVRFGTDHPRRDLEQNTIATFNVLEAARLNGVKGLAFSSTGSVYGEASVIPTPEDAPFPIQTSLYAASKLAGEGMIAAYAEGFGLQ